MSTEPGQSHPTRKDQRANARFAKAAYRRRNVVERGVGWLKENRRLATRYEKLALPYLAVVKLTIIRRCFTGKSGPSSSTRTSRVQPAPERSAAAQTGLAPLGQQECPRESA